MAENKKSFLIYCDIIHTVEHLTDEEKGKLFQHLLDYVNDKNPVLEDRLLLIAWKPIEQQLKRDLKKYESIRERNSVNARKRWDNKNATVCDRIPKVPNNTKNADKDTDIDTVIDTDIDIDTINNKIKSEILKNKNWIDIMRKTFNIEYNKFEELFSYFWCLNYDGHILENRPKQQNEIKRHFSNWTKKKIEDLKSKNKTWADEYDHWFTEEEKELIKQDNDIKRITTISN